MTSATDAIELATYKFLTEGRAPFGAVTGAQVHQHVPENTAPPVVIIGDMDADPLDAKDDPDRIVTLSIVTVTEAEERKSCLQLMDQAEKILGGGKHEGAEIDGAQIDIDGWRLAFSFLDGDAVLTPDGDGYVGTSRFTIMALNL